MIEFLIFFSFLGSKMNSELKFVSLLLVLDTLKRLLEFLIPDLCELLKVKMLFFLSG